MKDSTNSQVTESVCSGVRMSKLQNYFNIKKRKETILL